MSEPSVTPGGPEVRLSTLVGDRICIKCGFNLSGQPVVRENVYQMPIVRCPECSTVASLQEYPLLGRWAGRFAAMLAGIWLIVMIGLLFGSAGILFGISQGNIAAGSSKFATFIASKHVAWLETADDATRKAAQQWNGGRTEAAHPYTFLDGTWWRKQDTKALLVEAGGFRSTVDWRAFGFTYWLIVNGTWIGAVWSVFLLNFRRWRLLVFSLLPVAIALAFAFMANDLPGRMRGWGMGSGLYAFDAAQQILWPRLIAIGLGLGLVGLWIGLLVGRPAVRLLARLLLPPRMLGSLSFLWIADGKSPPRASGRQEKRPVR